MGMQIQMDSQTVKLEALLKRKEPNWGLNWDSMRDFPTEMNLAVMRDRLTVQ
jgi:hypothetical protein